jgi:hypothetical protein
VNIPPADEQADVPRLDRGLQLADERGSVEVADVYLGSRAL